MDFDYSARQLHWRDRTRAFIDDVIRPALPDYKRQRAEGDRWAPAPILDDLKAKARAEGLWNLCIPPGPHEDDDYHGAGLNNLDYALCAEEMGRLPMSSEVFNCSPPDSGNMEILIRYATPEQKRRYLRPLMDGTMRSAFLMTEPEVASSDATNLETRIERDGDHYVINGRKWWSSGLGDPRCKFAILMGKTDPDAALHQQQSQVLLPLDTPGITIERMLPVFGFDHAPHGHAQVLLENVRIPAENVLLGPGRGFEIAQGRLGPGRIHHCMRAIGIVEEALDKMIRRLAARTTFGRPVIENSIWDARIATARADIEMMRLLVLKAADRMDKVGNKEARLEIALIKIGLPQKAIQIIDDAIQAFGGAGVTEDAGLADAYATLRVLRIADGPDEVHWRTIARMERRRALA
ncbi:acyl-CoA dehydrogenase family protein [Nitratireductor alexandrii]|uniref:acyl-CoA dehydrogenase family protein n=1 Tax=Nitratireductor alexandrii TaxID=2448161 RepID=UPI000FDB8B89|nr:acyl-CoA dehydrogenase family protein [Nitratireductor alexandrii]